MMGEYISIKTLRQIKKQRDNIQTSALQLDKIVKEKQKEIERLNNIIDEALRKLRATKDHYKIEDINNAIMHTIRILERSDKE